MKKDGAAKIKLDGEYMIAFSGGGIRSATLSLGVAQGLARANRLSGLKIFSTVSGGGYFGSFLKSLYLPQNLRGMGARLPTEEQPYDHAQATQVLSADANEREIAGKPNPVQWLRRHSRFLAPNGSGDYWFAGAVMTRNWLGMLYVFVLAIALAMTASIWLQLGIRNWLSTSGQGILHGLLHRLWWDEYAKAPIFSGSIWFVLAALLAGIWAVLGTAFWHSETMPINPPDQGWSVRKLNRRSAFALGGLILFTAVSLGGLWFLAYQKLLHPGASADDASRTVWLGVGLTLFIVTTMATAAGFAIWVWISSSENKMGDNPYPLTSELRQRITTATGTTMRLTLIITAFAAVETAAVKLNSMLANSEGWSKPALWTAIIPAVAALIHRLAAAGGESDSPALKWIARHLTTVALVLAVILWGVLAILTSALVHAAFLQIEIALAMTFTLVVLAVLVIVSDGFINLSSLHGLYASRLTRAYLGATNEGRTSTDADPRAYPFTETHPGDYFEADTYFQGPGPEHIVNIALNETIDGSTGLPERDRMATILSIGRDGLRVGSSRGEPGTVRSWIQLADDKAERLAVGQWVAISGAAVTSGMGRMTSLGGALLLTFANLRLGYWWRKAKALESISWTRMLGPFRYLHAEMTARYTRGTYRNYLSDGGHFENTGTYGILMRHGEADYSEMPQLLIVADNGQDGRYEFADLEQLVRRARLDLGWAIEPVEPIEVAKQVSSAALKHFLNRPPDAEGADSADWRARAAAANGTGFAILLEATKCDTDDRITLIWLKPCRLADVSIDVAAYGLTNPSFPHQSTANQFFDEEQFESYRKLGQQMIERLVRDL